MIAHNGSKRALDIVEKIRQEHTFGEWKHVAKERDGIKYTGRTITCHGREIHVGLRDWIESPNNMMEIPIKKKSGRGNDDPLDEIEHGDFVRELAECIGAPRMCGLIML